MLYEKPRVEIIDFKAELIMSDEGGAGGGGVGSDGFEDL